MSQTESGWSVVVGEKPMYDEEQSYNRLQRVNCEHTFMKGPPPLNYQALTFGHLFSYRFFMQSTKVLEHGWVESLQQGGCH